MASQKMRPLHWSARLWINLFVQKQGKIVHLFVAAKHQPKSNGLKPPCRLLGAHGQAIALSEAKLLEHCLHRFFDSLLLGMLLFLKPLGRLNVITLWLRPNGPLVLLVGETILLERLFCICFLLVVFILNKR